MCVEHIHMCVCVYVTQMKLLRPITSIIDNEKKNNESSKSYEINSFINHIKKKKFLQKKAGYK